MRANRLAPGLGLLLVLAWVPTAWSHGEASHATRAAGTVSSQHYAWGMQGDPRKAVRIVPVSMADTMRFTPQRFVFRKGDTITFVVRNRGQAMHEFVIGTHDELQRHAELMKKHPGMEHDEPYMAHVAPGRTQRITWHFTEAGQFQAGCLLPGHYEAGMSASITIQE